MSIASIARAAGQGLSFALGKTPISAYLDKKKYKGRIATDMITNIGIGAITSAGLAAVTGGLSLPVSLAANLGLGLASEALPRLFGKGLNKLSETARLTVSS